MDIRRLAPGDEQAACDIVGTFRSSQVSRAVMAGFLANDRNYLTAAFDGARTVGYALGYEFQRIDGQGPIMLLYEIEVAASHRRRGIGRALVEQLKQTCRERGFAKMLVFTEESNGPAMALYASTGGERGALDAATFWYPRERL